MIIRPIERDELCLAAALIVESYQEETGKNLSYDKAMNAYLQAKPEDILLGAFDGDVMAATAMGEYRVNAEEYKIQSVYVCPEYRRQGLGRRILTHLLDCTDLCSEGCYLLVKKTNPDAIKLYRSLGFSINHDVSAQGEVNYMWRSSSFPVAKKLPSCALG